MSNSSIWSTDRTLSNVSILGLSGPGSYGNEEVLHIPQSSSITAEKQLEYSTIPADWAS